LEVRKLQDFHVVVVLSTFCPRDREKRVNLYDANVKCSSCLSKFLSTFIPKCSSNIHANCPMLSMLSVTIIIPLLVSIFTIYTRGKKRGERKDTLEMKKR